MYRDSSPPFPQCSRPTTTPAADFCRPGQGWIAPPSVPIPGQTADLPEVSSTAFRTQPPDLQPVPLMDMGFAVICPLARHRMPQIRFLYIGSYVCSTLLSDPPHGDALVLRYDFASIRLSKGLSPPSCRTCSAHKKEAASSSGGLHVFACVNLTAEGAVLSELSIRYFPIR